MKLFQSYQDGDFYVRFKDLRDNGLFILGYINGITENLSPSWASTEYIGRSIYVYSYQRAERDISFNLVFIHKIIKKNNLCMKRWNRLTSMVYVSR